MLVNMKYCSIARSRSCPNLYDDGVSGILLLPPYQTIQYTTSTPEPVREENMQPGCLGVLVLVQTIHY